MKLSRIEFSNYRSLQDESLDIDKFSTVLLGRNNVGKTNILQGILAFGRRTDFEQADGCNHAQPLDADPKLIFHFTEITQHDRERLGELPAPLSPQERLTIIREGNELKGYTILVDDEVFDFNLPDRIPAETEEVEQPNANNHAATEESTPEEEPTATGEPPEAATNGDVENGTPESQPLPQEEPPLDATQVSPEAAQIQFIEDLWEILPNILRFENPHPLQEQVTIKQLESTEEEFETARRLLRLAGVTDFNDLSPDDHVQGKDFRSETSDKLTKILQEHWLQDRNLYLDIDFQAPNLLFTFKEETAKSTYPQQHSDATIGYVSVLADILTRLAEASDESRTIILFDEPGTQLHPGGQRDLLIMFRDLSEMFQIIYTSHSPHLLDKNYPGQMRLITKSEKGTLINNKPHASPESYDTLAYEPLRAALGIGIGDALVFDVKNVIVEGPSDQILVSGFSQILTTAGYPHFIDLNFTAVMPAGSVNKIETLARMAKDRDYKVVALFDSDESGVDEVKRLTKKYNANPDEKNIVKPRELIQIGDAYSGDKPREIEDLFPKSQYFEAVNNLYGGLYDDWKEVSTKRAPFKTADGPIAKTMKEYFKDQEKYGDFDKVRVARELVNILRTTEILKADEQVKQQFEHAAKVIEMLKAVLEGKEPPRVLAVEAIDKPAEEVDTPPEENTQE